MTPPNYKHSRIILSGIVQGIGFRPSLFNLLRQYPISGEIRNSGNLGVILDLQFDATQISANDIIDIIKKGKPEMARLDLVKITDIPNTSNPDFNQLKIIPSNNRRGKALTLPPDIAVCVNCLHELKNRHIDRFYEYPFIACAQCGPRFTIMRTLPYDRENSTMDQFKFCKDCQQSYDNPQDRRFHAQTFSCKQCGPQYYLKHKFKSANKKNYQQNKNLHRKKEFNLAEFTQLIQTLREGKIAAIKGIGGVHLVCRADRENIITLLRSRKKKREYKPFAVMMPDLPTAHQYCEIPSHFEIILQSFRRPIVLLPKKQETLPNNIAPGLPNMGIVLPYMGLHYMIFDQLGKLPLIFTSGNISNKPMAIDNTQIYEDLHEIADFFYIHNREIYQRCDDSVLRPVNGIPTLIRRSRGYVPEYISLPFKSPYSTMLSVGAELNSTGAIARYNKIFPTQHIGNINDLDTYAFLEDAIKHLIQLLKIPQTEIKCITKDLHPAFLSGKLAEKLAAGHIPLVSIQHHHAHLAALMVDHQLGLNEKIIVITVDGVGFGEDTEPWGGEILRGGYNNYSREGYLQPMPMIGGDQCAIYPPRMLLSIIIHVAFQEKREQDLEIILQNGKFIQDLPHTNTEYLFITRKLSHFNDLDKTINHSIPMTSSLGRLLDAFAALVHLCTERTYRGEPAMRLEGFAWNPENLRNIHPFTLDNYIEENRIRGDKLLFDYAYLMYGQIHKEEHSHLFPSYANAYLKDLGTLFGKLAIKIAHQSNISRIGVSGGVAYNQIFMQQLKKIIEKEKISFLQHRQIPPGDAGISIGQLAIAAAQKLKNEMD